MRSLRITANTRQNLEEICEYFPGKSVETGDRESPNIDPKSLDKVIQLVAFLFMLPRGAIGLKTVGSLNASRCGIHCRTTALWGYDVSNKFASTQAVEVEFIAAKVSESYHFEMSLLLLYAKTG